MDKGALCGARYAWLRVLTAVFAFCALLTSASATPTHYVIGFTGTGGATAPTGGFDYDPATSTFSSFLVDWNGFSFDLTADANDDANPNVSGNSFVVRCQTSDKSTLMFYMMTQDSCVQEDAQYSSYHNFFQGSQNPSTDEAVVHFQIDARERVFSPDGSQDVLSRINLFASASGPIDTSEGFTGAFAATPVIAAAPEPAVLALLGAGIAGIGFARRRNRPNR
ncbi:MAG TPA: PEP-CTERM sorting domain-containing protein [Casimicrobiaceae bacterium]|nr:PEP-CTERM sorting domain-containing protein [Casimicrobiaceae bacterium]